jgi:predicted amidohydrolase YtcJ
MRNATARWGLLISLSVIAACAGSTVTPSPIGTPPAASPSTPTPTLVPTPTLQAEPADVIFHNGTVITIDKERPTAEAVAIKGQQIQAVGTEEKVMAYRNADTVVVDLQGHTLMPGFEDGHTHYVRNKWGDGASVEPLMNDLLSFGLTSETEMHSTNEFIQAMLSAERAGKITVRMNIFGEYNCGFLVDHKSVYCPSWYPDNPPILDPTSMVRIPGVKIFVDGAGGERGCPYMSFEWPSDITKYWPDIRETCTLPYGDLYLTEDELTRALQDVQDHGYRASLHVMGDAALDVTLNALQKVLNGKSNLVYRHQIQHSSTLRPDQVPRYRQMDLLAQVPGYFNTCEADIYEAMYPDDTYAWNTTRYSLPGLGVHTYYGGDSSGRVDIHKVGSALNPIWGLYGLVTRKQFRDDGTTCDPPDWIGKYKISVEQALEMMTIEPAYAVSMEDYTGSVEPGKFADLIVLSDNPLTMNPDDLYKLSVWMTMVGGEVGYCAEGKDAYCPTGKPQPTATPAASATAIASTGVAEVRFDCDARRASPIHVSAGDSIQTLIRWGAKTPAQLDDFDAAVRNAVFVDGTQVVSRISHGARELVSGTNLVAVRATFEVGVLKPGRHAIRTQLTFSRKITDGFDWYGPGTANPAVEGTCTVMVDQ